MAIRIIKHGLDFLNAQCPKCRCLFEFTVEDMETYFTGVDKIEQIRCPDCNYPMKWWYGEKSGRNATPYN